MKKQSTLVISLLLLSQATALHANEVAGPETISALSNEALTAAHSSDSTAKDQPFWSENQARQAELELKYINRIAENPDNKKNYAYLAGLYLTNNKTTKANDSYQDAITHDPENPKLFAGISIAYLHQAKFAMARAMADEALRLDPSLKQVAKINEYIIAKEEAIKAATNAQPANKDNTGASLGHAPIDAVHASESGSGATLGVAPVDAVHGSGSSTLNIDNPSDWVKTP